MHTICESWTVDSRISVPMPFVIWPGNEPSAPTWRRGTHVFEDLDLGREPLDVLVVLALEVVDEALPAGRVERRRALGRRVRAIEVRAVAVRKRRRAGKSGARAV